MKRLYSLQLRTICDFTVKNVPRIDISASHLWKYGLKH